MEQPPLLSPEPPKQEQEWSALLKDYLEKLQAIPANTLELSPEEQRGLRSKKRLGYRDKAAHFNELHSQDGVETSGDKRPRLLARIIEDLLARHDTLSRGWNSVRGNPSIIRASSPDDLRGVDFVLSFSENIACAVDITLAREGSVQEEKKLQRRKNYEKTFGQASITFWRFPDGAIGYKEFPFLFVHIFGPKAAAFIETSAAHLAEPQGNAYQEQYKGFFAGIMDTTAGEAKKMARNMLETSRSKGYFSPSLMAHITEIIQKHGPEKEKTRALIALRESIQNNMQRTYFDLLLRYQIIYSSGKTVARQLLSPSAR